MSISKLPIPSSRNLSTATIEEVQAEIDRRTAEAERLVKAIKASEDRLESLSHETNYWKGIFDFLNDKRILEDAEKKLQAETLTPEEIKQGFVIQDTGKEKEPCQQP